MMKTKFLLTVLFAFFVHNAYSQIKFEESFDNDLIIIGNISSGAALNALGGTTTVQAPEHRLYCRIFKDKTTYGILVSTSNRFDDDFEFALGTDIETAKESINAILGFIANSDKGKSISLTDEDNRRIQMNYDRKNAVTFKAISNTDEVVCDNVLITKKNFEKALLLLDTKAEEKVAKAMAKNKEN